MQRRRHVLRLRDQGLTLSEIARRFGVSKQAVWSLIHHRPRLLAGRALTCTGCGRQIVSPGALARDAENALCLDCLSERPQAPFAQRLRALRLASGLSQCELSKRTRLAPGSLRAYEDGRREPRRSTVGRLTRVLGVGLMPPDPNAPERRPCYSDAS